MKLKKSVRTPVRATTANLPYKAAQSRTNPHNFPTVAFAAREIAYCSPVMKRALDGILESAATAHPSIEVSPEGENQGVFHLAIEIQALLPDNSHSTDNLRPLAESVRSAPFRGLIYL
jgi:hypothetical protein